MDKLEGRLPMTSDDIGNRGQAIFYKLMTELCGRANPYFRPHFLGDKFPALDYLVELIEPRAGAPFFFVQVKSTARRPVRRQSKMPALRVNLSKREVQ